MLQAGGGDGDALSENLPSQKKTMVTLEPPWQEQDITTRIRWCCPGGDEKP
jgi:hypothetical protein